VRAGFPLAVGVLAVVASLQASLPLAAAALALAGAALLRFQGRRDASGVAFAVALVVGVAVFCGAGDALRIAFDAAGDVGPVGARTAALAGVVAAGAALLATRRGARDALRAFVAARPRTVVLVAGLVLGFSLSLRMFVDP